MRVLAIVHEADAGPGVFADAVTGRRDAQLDTWDLPSGGRPPGDPRGYDAVLTFGGAAHPDQEARHPWLADEKRILRDLLAHGRPLLGVCLGAQLLAEAAGANTQRARRPEVGWYPVQTTPAAAEDRVLGPLAPEFHALEWHSYEFELPPGATALASSAFCLQAFRLEPRAWGIQFHAEVTLADFTAWIEHERSPEELERLGFDARELRASVEAAIADWNRLGRALCARFLDAATA